MFGDVNVQKVVASGTLGCMHNSGQTCNAPTRMLVAQEIYDEAVEVAARTAAAVAVGDPRDQATFMGPVAGRKQFDTVRGYIQIGMDEGARLVAGGLERPDGLDTGFFVRPTVFADVTPDMRIFQEEIFGPVLCITPFRDEAHAIELANATVFGLSGYVQSADAGARAPGRRPDAHRHGAPERSADRRPRAVRRLPAVGQRPRVGPVRARGLPRGQVGHGLGAAGALSVGPARGAIFRAGPPVAQRPPRHSDARGRLALDVLKAIKGQSRVSTPGRTLGARGGGRRLVQGQAHSVVALPPSVLPRQRSPVSARRRNSRPRSRGARGIP